MHGRQAINTENDNGGHHLPQQACKFCSEWYADNVDPRSQMRHHQPIVQERQSPRRILMLSTRVHYSLRQRRRCSIVGYRLQHPTFVSQSIGAHHLARPPPMLRCVSWRACTTATVGVVGVSDWQNVL